MNYHMYYRSPIGQILLASDGRHLTGLWLDGQPHPADLGEEKCDLAVFLSVTDWLDRYFRGEVPAVNALPLSPAGTAFQKQVWDILLTIPYGQLRTYGDIAREISPTMSAQAVGGAVGRNPISIIIPCHRVLGTNGALTGYAGGLQYKKWLLTHEGCGSFSD